MNRNLRGPLAATVSAVLALALAAVVNISPASAAQSSTGGPANMLPSAVPSTITPAVNDGKVYATAQVGNTMIIGGSFTQVGGNSHQHLAIFNATTGALSAFAPTFNNDVNAVLPGPTATTVYVGGAFTQLNGVATQFVALLDLTTGQAVASFQAPVFDIRVRQRHGARAATGSTSAERSPRSATKFHRGLVSLNATTGALDPFMNVQLTGHHNDSGSGAQGCGRPVEPGRDRRTATRWSPSATSSGRRRSPTATRSSMIDLSGATAEVDPDWSTNRYAPYCFNWAFDTYVRGVSFSPDGSYFVVNATGGGIAGTLCDATARFETDSTGNDMPSRPGSTRPAATPSGPSTVTEHGRVRRWPQPLEQQPARQRPRPARCRAASGPGGARPDQRPAVHLEPRT